MSSGVLKALRCESERWSWYRAASSGDRKSRMLVLASYSGCVWAKFPPKNSSCSRLPSSGIGWPGACRPRVPRVVPRVKVKAAKEMRRGTYFGAMVASTAARTRVSPSLAVTTPSQISSRFLPR